MMNVESEVRTKYKTLASAMNERVRRLWAGTEAQALGRGGISCVHRATGLSINTIIRGMHEKELAGVLPVDRVRSQGGGRKLATELNPKLKTDLERLVEPVTRGDPETPLRWTCKSTRRLESELTKQGYTVSHALIARLLNELGYSLQSNNKTLEGTSHPDRNAQFEYINQKVQVQLRRRQPAISVDTKKKELVGAFKNGGQEWHLKGKPEKVKVHDFLDPHKGKAIPYGVYDLSRNTGWVSVGIDHDTATFAVSTIHRWWRTMGRMHYLGMQSLLIIADSGGSNGSRVRLWKWELQKLSNRLGCTIMVSHLPPGTSKWNKIEHRLFSFISKNWRGKPLLTHATIVNLISNTRTSTGLKVRCLLDRKKYSVNIKPTDKQMAMINLKRDKFHGDWNYLIRPNKKSN